MKPITTESVIYQVIDDSYDGDYGVYTPEGLERLVSEWDQMEPLEAPRALTFAGDHASIGGVVMARLVCLIACDGCGLVG